MKFDVLTKTLREMATAEGGPMFLEWPDRWYEGGLWRCANDHVSRSTLKTEKGSRCLACFGKVHMTFPEDVEGPLGHPRITAVVEVVKFTKTLDGGVELPCRHCAHVTRYSIGEIVYCPNCGCPGRGEAGDTKVSPP